MIFLLNILLLLVHICLSQELSQNQFEPSYPRQEIRIQDFQEQNPEDVTANLNPNPPLLQKSKSLSHVVNECITISMEQGSFHYKSKGGSSSPCGLYLVSDPDTSILIQIQYVNLPCQDGLISVVDGWELNGEVFPSSEGGKPTFYDICSTKDKYRKIILSSQNAALIQYKIPKRGQGFSIRVKHIKNPRPCNILVQDTEGIYSLDNFGGKRNCSITTLFDSKMRILYLSTGQVETRLSSSSPSSYQYPYSYPIRRNYNTIPGNVFHNCDKLGSQDYLEIGGSFGLDASKMKIIDKVCGHQTYPMGGTKTIFCGVTTLRLVSSGKFQNNVVVQIKRAEVEDLDNADYICGM